MQRDRLNRTFNFCKQDTQVQVACLVFLIFTKQTGIVSNWLLSSLCLSLLCLLFPPSFCFSKNSFPSSQRGEDSLYLSIAAPLYYFCLDFSCCCYLLLTVGMCYVWDQGGGWHHHHLLLPTPIIALFPISTQFTSAAVSLLSLHLVTRLPVSVTSCHANGGSVCCCYRAVLLSHTNMTDHL